MRAKKKKNPKKGGGEGGFTQSNSPHDRTPVGNAPRRHDNHLPTAGLLRDQGPDLGDEAHDASAGAELVAAGVDALGDEHVGAVAEGLARGGHVADLHKDLEAAVVAGRDDVGVGAALLSCSRVRGEEPDGLGDLWDGKLLICGGQGRLNGISQEEGPRFLESASRTHRT